MMYYAISIKIGSEPNYGLIKTHDREKAETFYLLCGKHLQSFFPDKKVRFEATSKIDKITALEMHPECRSLRDKLVLADMFPETNNIIIDGYVK